MQLIETNNLSKQYGKKWCVKDVSLKIQKGSIYGFLGPNGAGKSTTLKMILGLARPSKGQIKIHGKAVTKKNHLDVLKNTGALIEAPSHYPHLTGRENLQIAQILRDLPEKQIDDVLEIVGLSEHKYKKTGQYSLGMKQRLGLAAAMLGFPELLILDEPTNGLDPEGIHQMRELILSLPGRFGMTVLVSSHLLSEVDQMATHVGIINNGRLIYQDSLDALHQKSCHHLAIRTLDDHRAIQVLKQQGIRCRQEEDHLALPLMTDGDVARTIWHLTDQAVGIVRLQEKQKNLEEIFLELTGREVAV